MFRLSRLCEIEWICSALVRYGAEPAEYSKHIGMLCKVYFCSVKHAKAASEL